MTTTGQPIDVPGVSGILVPARHEPDETSFDWRPRAVEDWLQCLPVANLGETSRRVHEALHAVNRLELPPAARLRFLEQLREIVAYIGNGLRRHYVGRELPLQSKPRRIAELATLLHQEAALGYEIAVVTLLGDATGQGERRSLALALQRAIHGIGRLLLENWVVYQTPPAGSWRRLHDLYAIAEHCKLHEQRVPAPGVDDKRGRSTPVAAYKQVVLTAAAGPGRMQQGEVADAWTLLGHWADAAQLVDPADAAAVEAVFRVPRASDAPPHASVKGLNRDSDRLLVTVPLIQSLQRALATTGHRLAFWRRRPLADVPPELTNRLVLALGAVPSRRHARLRTDAKVKVIIGLTQLHRVLCRELGWDDDKEPSTNRNFAARETRSATATGSDVWDLVYTSDMIRALEQEQRLQAMAEQRRVDHDELQDWQLINLSGGGYCLLSDPHQAAKVQVGELIMLRELTGRSCPWQLGTVRWLRTPPDQGLQAGVEILAPGPLPIRLRSEHDDGRFGPFERGLLLPSMSALEQPATLIAPGPHYTPGRPTRLRHGRRESALVLERQRDATPHYTQFEFRRGDPLEDQGDLSTLLQSAD